MGWKVLCAARPVNAKQSGASNERRGGIGRLSRKVPRVVAIVAIDPGAALSDPPHRWSLSPDSLSNTALGSRCRRYKCAFRQQQHMLVFSN